jgi:oxygen-dependent protoporphyrinogen oxidase
MMSTSSSPHTPVTRIVIVGGGIAGLAAAWELSTNPGIHVTILEADDRWGGKIRTEQFAGRSVDVGPDAFLARRPEAVELCGELGLTADLVAPGATGASVWARGRLRRLPDGLSLGVPTRLGPLWHSGILSPLGLARFCRDLLAFPRGGQRRWAPLATQEEPGADRSVGAIVASRLGAQVAARFADPLIGGINAGPITTMSAATVFPALLQAAQERGSLARALGRSLSSPAPPGKTDGPATPPPLFLAPRGGLTQMVNRLVELLSARSVELHASCRVERLERSGDSWTVQAAGGRFDADGLLFATPAVALSGLLRPFHAGLADLAATIDASSVSVVTFAYPRHAVQRTLDGTGYLVPAETGRLLTGCTWLSTKWPHLAAPDDLLLRASAGRYGDTRADQLDDTALVAELRKDLHDTLGVTGEPLSYKVTRWTSAFPQYRVGHLGRVEALEAAATELRTVTLAGAAYRGVGIPACIGSGRSAARTLLERLHRT